MVRYFLVAVCVAFCVSISAYAQEEETLELVSPAPGCPATLPSRESARYYCAAQSEQQCRASTRCYWSSLTCHPQGGTFVDVPSLDPQALNRYGMHFPVRVTVGDADKFAGAAYVSAAAKRYDQAIGLYTKALTVHRGNSEYLVKRGLVYEHKGDRKRALADYCMSIAAANDWQSEQMARERIGQITNPNAEPMPIPFFSNSAVLRVRGQAHAPLTVNTPEGWDYLLRFVNRRTGSEDLLVFVRASSQFRTKVPLGEYRIVGAQGPVWYGPRHYFGDKTRYFKLRSDEWGETARFYREGNMVYGRTFTFIKQQGGNMSDDTINREEFER